MNFVSDYENDEYFSGLLPQNKQVEGGDRRLKHLLSVFLQQGEERSSGRGLLNETGLKG